MQRFEKLNHPSLNKRFHWWCVLPMLAALTALFLLAQSTHACSCVEPPPPEEALANASAVFAGKVTKIANTDNGVKVTFKVYTGWKGLVEAEMSVLTSSSSASCGYAFEKDQEYLVYATQEQDGTYLVSLCSRTKLLNTAGEDLNVLKEGSIPLQPVEEVSAVNRFFSSWMGVVTIGIGLGLLYIILVVVRSKVLRLSRHTLPVDAAKQPDKPEE